jgi:hypothetical protein
MYGARHPQLFESPKIIISKITTKGYGLRVAYDRKGYFCDQRLICLARYGYLQNTNLRLNFKGYSRVADSASDLYYTAVLNSCLYVYYFGHFVATRNLQGEYSDVVPQMIRSLPVRQPDLSDAAERQRHDHLADLAETMRILYENYQHATTSHDKKLIQRQIDATDNQIDQLVYELYDLTEEEIRIVEEAIE